MIADLPHSLTVNGVEYPIRTDYRDALDALIACNATDLSPLNIQLTILDILYGDNIPSDVNEAARLAAWFLDGGDTVKPVDPPSKVIDYEQDAQMLFSAVNRVAGREIRDPDVYTHWWTFLGYCAEISQDSPISHVVQIRHKLVNYERLDNNEKKFYYKNRHIIDMKSSVDDYNKVMCDLRELGGG